jgi:3',5'-cyclic AMP phosphodiesterase CpdA
MKPTRHPLSLLLTALLLLCAASAAFAAPFSFVAIGDSRGSRFGEPVNRAVLSQVVAKILELQPRPAFVLVAGDLVMGDRIVTMSREVSLARELRAWQTVMAPLTTAGIRVYCVPGNHEIWGSYAHERERACRQVLGELQYSFRHEGSWFVGLNTDRPGKRRTPDLAWLEVQLLAAKTAGAEHIFVFGHEPALGITGRDDMLRDAAAFWELLVRHGVDAYICGHEHIYGRASRSGVYQVITGGAGAPLFPLWGAEGFEVALGTYHLTEWRVDGPRVEARVLAFGAGPGEWRQIDSFSYVKPGKPAIIPVKAAPQASPARSREPRRAGAAPLSP